MYDAISEIGNSSNPNLVLSASSIWQNLEVLGSILSNDDLRNRIDLDIIEQSLLTLRLKDLFKSKLAAVTLRVFIDTPSHAEIEQISRVIDKDLVNTIFSADAESLEALYQYGVDGIVEALESSGHDLNFNLFDHINNSYYVEENANDLQISGAD